MINDNAKLWIETLESDRFKQGRNRLAVRSALDSEDFEFCCLGVACELYVEANPDEIYVEETSYGKGYDGYDVSLPVKVREWLGLADYHGRSLREDVVALTYLNDSGYYSFKEIAAVLKDEENKYFVD